VDLSVVELANWQQPMVGRIGGRISVMTEWLSKQILDDFLRQFQTKAQAQEGTTQNCKGNGI